MTSVRRNVSKVLVFALALPMLLVLLALPHSALATNAAGLVTYINGLGNGLVATATTATATTVTVTGAAANVANMIDLTIDAGVTVLWNADLNGTASNMIGVNGSGTFKVQSGTISGTQTAIYMFSPNVTLEMSGGVVESTATAGSNPAIYLDGGSVTVRGGTVSAVNRNAIFGGGTGTVTVDGGTVSSAGNNAAIQLEQGTVEVKSGEVKNTGNSGAIRAKNVTVSGGTVQSAGSNATISSVGSVTVSGTGAVKNTGTGRAIYSGGSVTVNGGTVQNTGTGGAIWSGGSVTVSGGTVEGSGTESNATISSVSVTVSGTGVVKNTGDGSAIIANTVVVSGGSVEGSGASASVIKAEGDVTVSGGTVEATAADGTAIVSTGTITVSDPSAVTGDTVELDNTPPSGGQIIPGGPSGSTTRPTTTTTTPADTTAPAANTVETPYGTVTIGANGVADGIVPSAAVTTKKTTVYDQEKTDKKIGTLAKGTDVTIVTMHNGMAVVQYEQGGETYTGAVALGSLSGEFEYPVYGATLKQGVRLYAKNARGRITSAKLRYGAAGAKLKITGLENGYWVIDVKGETYYVKAADAEIK